MTPPDSRYADWKAPKHDGATLIWPDPSLLIRQTHHNAKKLASAAHVRIQNTPLPVLRRELRTFIGHDDARPLIATGHQTELYHPGVWVKLCLIDALAQKLSGDAYHVAVDTDAPKHLSIRWPGTALPLTDDPQLTAAAWSGLLQTPTPAHLRELEASVSAASQSWKFSSLLPEFLDQTRPLLLDVPNLSAAVTNSTHRLDWSLGLRHHALLASPLWESGPYLAFAHHLMAKADEFSSYYNSALATYRKTHKLRSEARPMPNLTRTDDACEVPFWLDHLWDGSRDRATVQHRDGQWTLQLNQGEFFAFDQKLEAGEAASTLSRFLRRHSLRLSPRALTLTMFVRLVMADQFVHGIGGGRYDQVTDEVILKHFGLEPPAFSVTTGTLYWPDAVGRERACLQCLAQEGHQLKHAVLGEHKSSYLDQINRLPRRSLQRKLVFSDMHRKLASAAVDHPSILAWATRVEAAADRDEQDAKLFDRELFYGVQSRERLTMMIEKYRSAVAQAVV